MGLIETEAFVLRSYNLAEADKIVICLTREAGIVRGVARGARRLKSRFGAGLEPFTLLHLSYFEKEGRELVSLRQAEIIRSHFSLAASTEAVAVLDYMAELLMEFSPPCEPNEKMFRMVSACLEALAENPRRSYTVLRYFEIWLLKLAGFLPDVRHCADCHKRLDAQESVHFNVEGRPRCRACSKGVGIELSCHAHSQLLDSQRLSPKDFVAKLSQDVIGMELAHLTKRLIEKSLDRPTRTQISMEQASSE